MILIVKRLEALAVKGASDHDLRAVQLLVVEGVHGLTVFEHNVVGNVYDVVDGTNARRAKSHAKPKGRGSDLDVLDHSCRIAVAEVGGIDADGEMIFDLVAVACTLNGGGRKLPLAVEGNGGLAGKTNNRETVGAVGGDLKLNHLIVKEKCLLDVHAHLVCKLVTENEDAVLDGIGHIVKSKIQLGDGAEHTVRLHATELAVLDGDVAGELCHGDGGGYDSTLKYVLCARNNLGGLAATDVHLADPQVVGVGVAFHGNDPGDHHVLNVRAEDLIALDLGARVGHAVAIILDIDIADVNEVSKPFHR